MNYGQQIAKGWADVMAEDPKVVILGEGVTDHKGLFGTTLACHEKFPDRVIETPVSENMITGACLGMALEGWKPVLVHNRVEFMMLSMEHIVNTIAKYRAIHGRDFSLVIRALVGRGWGQGPNHSQAFHSMFAHVPGLRVLYPVHADNMRYHIDNALNWGGPTIILEPRRMYDVEFIEYPAWENPDTYIATFGDIVLDAAIAATHLSTCGIEAQVWPIEDVTHMEIPPKKFKSVVIADTGHLFCGASAELATLMHEADFARVKRVGPPFCPLPTSAALEAKWYPTAQDISDAVCEMFGVKPTPLQTDPLPVDAAFKGPF